MRVYNEQEQKVLSTIQRVLQALSSSAATIRQGTFVKPWAW